MQSAMQHVLQPMVDAAYVAHGLRISVSSGIVLSTDFGVEAVDSGGGELDLCGLAEEIHEEQERLSVPGHSSAWLADNVR